MSNVGNNEVSTHESLLLDCAHQNLCMYSRTLILEARIERASLHMLINAMCHEMWHFKSLQS